MFLAVPHRLVHACMTLHALTRLGVRALGQELAKAGADIAFTYSRSVEPANELAAMVLALGASLVAFSSSSSCHTHTHTHALAQAMCSPHNVWIDRKCLTIQASAGNRADDGSVLTHCMTCLNENKKIE